MTMTMKTMKTMDSGLRSYEAADAHARRGDVVLEAQARQQGDELCGRWVAQDTRHVGWHSIEARGTHVLIVPPQARQSR